MNDKPDMIFGFPVEYSDLMPIGEIAVTGYLFSMLDYATGETIHKWIGGDAVFVARESISGRTIPKENDIIPIGPYMLKMVKYDPMRRLCLFFRQRHLETDLS